MEYIWLHDQSPILEQVSGNFKSAAILLHPFAKMSCNWKQEKNTLLHNYPSKEQCLISGKAISWKKIIELTDLCSYEEIALGLMTSISRFYPEYAREDLAEKLKGGLDSSFYYTSDDCTSIFLLQKMIEIYEALGVTNIFYGDPISGHKGEIDISSATPLVLAKIAERECLFIDEHANVAFLSIFDSFTTLLLCKDDNVKQLIKHFDLEAIVCDDSTKMGWYFDNNL